MTCRPLHPAPSPRSRVPRRHADRARRAFSLVELIVASIVVSFIVAATTASLSQSIRARDSAQGRNEAYARATAAADRIAADAESAVRDPILEFSRISARPGGAPAARADELLLFSRSLRRVRPALTPGSNNPPEGGEHEVHYRLEPDRARSSAPGLVLWRRVAPVIDDVPDGGGIAAPIATGIRSLSIQAYNGVEWFDSWDSDYQGYPHALRITVTAADDRTRTTAVARRTVALDRTPLPLESADPAAAESDSAPAR